MKKILYILLFPLTCLGQVISPSDLVNYPREENIVRRAGTTATAVHTAGIFWVTDYGAKLDGVTNDSAAVTAAITAAAAWKVSNSKNPTIYFPDGVCYTTHFEVSDPTFTVEGQSKENSIVTGVATWPYVQECNMKNITLKNVTTIDYYCTDNTITCTNVKYLITNGGGSTYIHNIGYANQESRALSNYTFENCEFTYNEIYSGFYADVKNITIKNCTFGLGGGVATHPIRINHCDSAYIYGNTVEGGTTGVFFSTRRTNKTKGAWVENNTVYNQVEESISFDGLGNNYQYCPVIGNGRIDSVNNDGNGDLTLRAWLTYVTNGGGDTARKLINSDTNWTNFYFSFLNGKLAGQYFAIKSYDTTKNLLTLNTKISKDSVALGDTASVDAGFFDCTIKNNTIYGNAAGVGISIYLNCFNFNVYGNNVHDCDRGLIADGGLMLSNLRTKAWGINVHDNTFTDCPTWGANFTNLYSTSIYGYDNILHGNTFTRATPLNSYQKRFTNSGNTIIP